MKAKLFTLTSQTLKTLAALPPWPKAIRIPCFSPWNSDAYYLSNHMQFFVEIILDVFPVCAYVLGMGGNTQIEV